MPSKQYLKYVEAYETDSKPIISDLTYYERVMKILTDVDTQLLRRIQKDIDTLVKDRKQEWLEFIKEQTY